MKFTSIRKSPAANQKRVKQQYFFVILLFAYVFIIFAVVIVFKIGYRLAEKEMRSAAMQCQKISSTKKYSKKQKKFKVWMKNYLTKFCLNSPKIVMIQL